MTWHFNIVLNLSTDKTTALTLHIITLQLKRVRQLTRKRLEWLKDTDFKTHRDYHYNFNLFKWLRQGICDKRFQITDVHWMRYDLLCSDYCVNKMQIHEIDTSFYANASAKVSINHHGVLNHFIVWLTHF